ncbi:MAG: flagellar basal-body rod protein FlgG [Peptococcaceae bacterium]
MLRAIANSMVACNAQQIKLDTIASNIANVNTMGYKKNKVIFTSLVYQQIVNEQNPVLPDKADNIYDGTGVKVAVVDKVFTIGPLMETGHPLDLAINGPGFFGVTLPDGNMAYTRAGNLQLDKEGNLVTCGGYIVAPEIKLPENYRQIMINQKGKVEFSDAAGIPQEAGELELYNFTAPAALQKVEDNLYLYTPAAGKIKTGKPGESGFGTLKQGFYEVANVDLIEEMSLLIEALRAYQLNTQAIRTSNEMWGLSNNLRK